MPLITLCVFCASAEGVKPAYRQAAEELGTLLAQRGIGLVYGGATAGLMGAVADAALNHGGKVIGVIPHVLVDKEVAHSRCTELHVVDTMHTRKALMGERADAFLILPGGYGTLEELFEVLAWQTLRLHSKPMCLLNTAGFYDGLLQFLDTCVAEGVLKREARQILMVADTVVEALGKIEAAL
ncbi:MAG: TIGR00730 family Rossman fold protein [Janthinobacterium lividum]